MPTCATKVVHHPDGYYFAECTCGWVSRSYHDASDAEVRGNLHVTLGEL